MQKFKEWIKNGDHIFFFFIFLIAGIIFSVELFNFNSVMIAIAESFYRDGVVAGIFATCGSLLPPAVLIVDISWIYKSFKEKE